MKSLLAFAFVFFGVAVAAMVVADENHDILSKIMTEGLKGGESPLAKVLDGKATDDEVVALHVLIKEMEGTKAPVGNQSEYETKVAELIAAMDVIATGDKGEAALDRLDNASNCKACHNNHKPKKE